MPISTIANLTIEKLKSEGFVHFVTLELEQFIADHARVKIKIDLEEFGENVLSDPMDRIALINEKFQINIQTVDKNETATDVYDFLGIITDVQVELDAGQHGWMYIYGASQSIELERGKMLKTHSDKKLQDIVGDVIKDKVHVMVANDPEYTTKIPFSMQYYESDYQYIKRLAWMYGEKLLFNGNNLIFGKIIKENTTKVTYNDDLVEVKLNSRLISNRFKQYYHNLQEEKITEKEEIDKTDTFTNISGAQSHKLNQKEHLPVIPIATPVYDDGSLKTLTEIRKKATMNRMFFVTGKTNIYRITIGELLEIDFDDKMTVDESVGTLRITRVLHSFDQNKRYYNEFEACQKDYDYFPYEDVTIPVAQPLTATVKNNNDPENLGRVQLVFDFEEEQCLHWFRCSTIDGGGNESIGIEKNRGINFVPEEKDRVYLGFMEGNPDKPFVMGSFFHKNNAENLGGNPGNHVKFIRDKSGTEIMFNDEAGSIHIKDKNGSESKITLDGEKNITVESDKSVDVNVGKGKCVLHMQDDGTTTITAENKIEFKVGGSTYTMTPDKIKQESKQNAIVGTNHITGGDTKIDGGNVFIN